MPQQKTPELAGAEFLVKSQGCAGLFSLAPSVGAHQHLLLTLPFLDISAFSKENLPKYQACTPQTLTGEVFGHLQTLLSGQELLAGILHDFLAP